MASFVAPGPDFFPDEYNWQQIVYGVKKNIEDLLENNESSDGEKETSINERNNQLTADLLLLKSALLTKAVELICNCFQESKLIDILITKLLFATNNSATNISSNNTNINVINNKVKGDVRKELSSLIHFFIKRRIGSIDGYFLRNKQLIDQLVFGYHAADSALLCGTLLRELITRTDDIARYILNNEVLLHLFFDNYVHSSNFDVASDAFNTLSELLTTKNNKIVSAQVLDLSADDIMSRFVTLLASDNYVTRRRSLVLLQQLLLERCNYDFMMKFIASKDNLKIIMNLLKNRSPNIQYESFQVFRIFVANPHKSYTVSNILFNNRIKLVSYLESFLLDKQRDDNDFKDEIAAVIMALKQLGDPGPPTPSNSYTTDSHSSSSSSSTTTTSATTTSSRNTTISKHHSLHTSSYHLQTHDTNTTTNNSNNNNGNIAAAAVQSLTCPSHDHDDPNTLSSAVTNININTTRRRTSFRHAHSAHDITSTRANSNDTPTDHDHIHGNNNSNNNSNNAILTAVNTEAIVPISTSIAQKLTPKDRIKRKSVSSYSLAQSAENSSNASNASHIAEVLSSLQQLDISQSNAAFHSQLANNIFKDIPHIHSDYSDDVREREREMS